MTVATNTTTTDTEAPEGFISKADVLRIAMDEGQKRGWCNELKDVLKERFGIEVPERPDNLSVRVTIDLPAELMDYASGKEFWVKWEATAQDAVALNDGEYDYGLTNAQWAVLSAFQTLRRRVDDSYGSRQREAQAVMQSAKVELIRSGEK